MMDNCIHIKGAREQNLKNIEVLIPRGKLTVITGVSGSGKSSLAFDTLYAEGYRKYMDSLSHKARLVLAQLPKPDVDYIHGLSPVIAIDQRTTRGANPKTTLATVTEIADYAQLLWANLGIAYNPENGARIEKQTIDDGIKKIFAYPKGSRLMVLAPVLFERPAVLREELPRLMQKGFQRVRMYGEIYRLDEPGILRSGNEPVAVDVVVDRIVLQDEQRSRLADSLEIAFAEAGDRALILLEKEKGDWLEIPISQHWACVETGKVFPELTTRHFSYTHAEGACPSCEGTGLARSFVPELIVPDGSKSVRGGAIKPWRIGSKSMIIERNARLKQLSEQLPFDANLPWRELPAEVQRQILYGCGDRLFSFKVRPRQAAVTEPFAGVVADLEHSLRTSTSEGLQARLMTYQSTAQCPVCGGHRLSAYSAAVQVAGLTFPQFMSFSVQEALIYARALCERESENTAMRDPLVGLVNRLQFLQEVGLGYLTLSREYGTLSGGEVQRAKLATQLGMELVGVTYVLDEPSIGLHPSDHEKLISLLRGFCENGNTVVVVEHDVAMMRSADYLIEIGPGAGEHGGRLIFSGDQAMYQQFSSMNAAYLRGEKKVVADVARKTVSSQWIRIVGAAENNLQSVDVQIPVGAFTVVCGVSGSGKSTLINDILAKAAGFVLNHAHDIPGKHEKITGWEYFDRAVRIDQSPIGRSPRSNPATYTKAFDLLRSLFAQCPLAKVRGYSATRFSFNVKGGRCERCKGDGKIKLDMQFMADAYVDCPSCQGKRYNRETLEIRYKGLTIAEVLEMTVEDAVAFFSKHPKLSGVLQTLEAVGLGYIKLGQAANTLSGGEAQRVKLSLELSKRGQGRTLYILDEPTTGLSWYDTQKLADILFRLREEGNTIVVIEHNTDIIQLADYVIELGPDGGDGGGKVVFEGFYHEMKTVQTRTSTYLNHG